MEQYISKSAVVAEIKSLRRTSFTNFDEGVNATVQTLLETLDTLEVKEVGISSYVNSFWDACIKHKNERGGNVVWSNKIEITALANYFFELGLKATQKGGEE